MKKNSNKNSTIFLRFMIYLIAMIVIALCIFGLPNAIGSFSWGGYDPMLIGMYLPAIPFFIGIYQILKLLNYIDHNKAFSELSVKALKNIRNNATIISIFYGLSLPYIFYLADQDDAPGVLLIGLVLTFAPLVVAVFSAVLQKLVQNAIEIQSENDLIV